MVSLDSLKLSVDIDALKDFNMSKFDRNTKQTDTKEVHWLTSKQQQLGLKGLKLFDGSVELETSAKILKDQYLDGLNKSTFERYVDEINKTGLVVFDLPTFQETAQIQKLDVTTNTFPTGIEKTIRDLSIYSTQKGYRVSPYNTGIVATGKAKSNTTRLIAYGKEDELKRNTKANKELLEHFSIERAKGILRFETNLRHYKDIRDAFHLRKDEPILLKTILDSDTKVLYDTFNKLYTLEIETSKTIKRKQDTMSQLFNSNRSYKQTQKEYFMRELIVHCKYDIDLIMKFVKLKVKGNTSSYRRDYEKLIKVMQYEQLENSFESLKEVKELLRVA